MSLLRYTCSSLFLPSTSISVRCLSSAPPANITASLPLKRPPTRSLLIKNFPRNSTEDDFFTLRGVGMPIESMIRNRKHNELEVRYLEADSAKFVRALASKKQLAIGGTILDMKLIPSRRLPVEVVAELGLRSASRAVTVRDLRGLKENELKEEISRRFGKVERVWTQEDGQRAIVYFFHMRDAMKARKTLHDEGWLVNFREELPRIPKVKLQDPDNPHYAVYLDGLPVQFMPRDVLRSLNDVVHLQNGDPMRVHTTRNGAYLIFSDPSNAEKFSKFYKPPPGVRFEWSPKDRPPVHMERAAIKLGASRTIIIDGFKDPEVTFDRLHQDFSNFGEIFFVYLDQERAHARVVFTNIASSLKAIDDIHNNRGKYNVYHGARITFGHIRPKRDELSHLRPIFMSSTDENLKTPTDTEDYDDWEDIDSSSDLGKVEWTEVRGENTRQYRLDVSPKRTES